MILSLPLNTISYIPLTLRMKPGMNPILRLNLLLPAAEVGRNTNLHEGSAPAPTSKPAVSAVFPWTGSTWDFLDRYPGMNPIFLLTAATLFVYKINAKTIPLRK